MNEATQQIILRAFPSEIMILNESGSIVLATHARCFGRNQDIYCLLHYLPLLEQRPRAFAHAKPIRQIRSTWPVAYEQLLTHLTRRAADDDKPEAIPEFVRVLGLLHDCSEAELTQAIEEALALRCATLDGIKLCLRRTREPYVTPTQLDVSKCANADRLTQGQLAPASLDHFDTLLAELAVTHE